ncbi:hypothetical protein GQ53DRAFT_843054 [Thozetella sp. PMI_491]|nr:hypothetical protein GQ53DRAFT_843054 [Thozetella sp. PMI_491]
MTSQTNGGHSSEDDNDLSIVIRRSLKAVVRSSVSDPRVNLSLTPRPVAAEPGGIRKDIFGTFLRPSTSQNISATENSSRGSINGGGDPGASNLFRGTHKEASTPASVNKPGNEERTQGLVSLDKDPQELRDDSSDEDVLFMGSAPRFPATQHQARICSGTENATLQLPLLSTAGNGTNSLEKKNLELYSEIGTTGLSNSRLGAGSFTLKDALDKRGRTETPHSTPLLQQPRPMQVKTNSIRDRSTTVSQSLSSAGSGLPLQPIQAGGQAGSSRSRPPSLNLQQKDKDAELYKQLAAKVPPKRTTQLVNVALPEPRTASQRDAHAVLARSMGSPARPPNPTTGSCNRHEPLSVPAMGPSQSIRSDGYSGMSKGLISSGTSTNPDVNRSLHATTVGPREIPSGQRIVQPHYVPAPRLPRPPPPKPPRKSRNAARKTRASAATAVREPSPAPTESTLELERAPAPDAAAAALPMEVFDEDSVIVHYVTCRTPRFHPSDCPKEAGRIRGVQFRSRGQANKLVRTQYEKPTKDVTGKQFKIIDGLFQAAVEYATGHVQHFWIEIEHQDMRTMEQMRLERGEKAILVDKKMAKIYHKRFDVVSVKALPRYKFLKEDGRVKYWDNEDDDGSKDEEKENIAKTAKPAIMIIPADVDTPMDLFSWDITFHDSFTTLEGANRAAIRLVEKLARPCRPWYDDICAYKEVVGQLRSQAEAWPIKTAPMMIEWEVPTAGYHWDFLQLRVLVKESELKGPKDIGDMEIVNPVLVEHETNGNLGASAAGNAPTVDSEGDIAMGEEEEEDDISVAS